MRKAIAAALLLLLPAGAALGQQDMYPVETVESTGLNTLTGVWKISFPDLVLSNSFRWSRAGETFCRVTHDGGDEAAVICLAGGAWRSGTATLDGKALHFAWGSMMTRQVLDTVLESNTDFRGVFALKLSGIRHNAALLASGQRYTVPASAPDAAGKAGLVAASLAQLAGGGIMRPHDDAIASKFFGAAPNAPAEILALGVVEDVVYLGEGKVRQWPRQGQPEPPPFVFDVYQVEFANGQRLCAIHQRSDGGLDGFLCA